MNKDQRLLEEAYDEMGDWEEWLSELVHNVNDDGTVDVYESVDLSSMGLFKLPFKFRLIDSNFNCGGNSDLGSLKGTPTIVNGNFVCYIDGLKTLEYGPTTVKGNYNCDFNKLESLKGAPTSVGGDFYCYDNKLTSLEGAPTTVGGVFNCRGNKLTSLKYLPKARGYDVHPFTQADVQTELERQDLEKNMSPTARAAWGIDSFADL